MRIHNIHIYTEDHVFRPGIIEMETGIITKVWLDETPDDSDFTGEILDGEGCYAIPGLIDLHFHGCKGRDFCDGTREALEEIAEYEASIGVTAMTPATMTLPVEELERVLANASKFQKNQDPAGADLVGINMEGPFISKEKKGAQDAQYILPFSAEIFHRFQAAAEGLVKFIGIAPEEGDGEAFIREIKDEVNVSLAHTNADYDTALKAFQAGANHAVHLYNAMSPFTHRAPGVVGAVADSGHVTAELICDGIHVHPSVVRSTFKMLGWERIILISDSMRAAGMPDGVYTLGGLDVNVQGNQATLVSDGALAGSVTNLFDCMCMLVRDMGIPLEIAVACATENPAKSLGIFHQYGSISPGKKGNVLLMDGQLHRKMVIKDGQRL